MSVKLSPPVFQTPAAEERPAESCREGPVRADHREGSIWDIPGQTGFIFVDHKPWMSVTVPCPLVSLDSPFFSSLACSALVQLRSSRSLVLLLVSVSGADPCSLAECAACAAQL